MRYLALLFFGLLPYWTKAQNPIVNATLTNVSCYGANDGNIEYFLSGGEAPFSFIWSDNDSGVTIGDCSYRINLVNPGDTLTDFQIEISVNYDSLMNADFSDIFFTNSDGSSMYSFWLETFTTSTNATFWVKVTTIPPGNSTIYLSFCDTADLALSDPYATFDFFDDFDDNDISDWTAGCEQNNHPSGVEYCNQSVSNSFFISPAFSLSLSGHASCLTPPFDGVQSVLNRSIALADGMYIIDFEDRVSAELYDFCIGNTNGRNRVYADSALIGNGSSASVAGSCSTVINGWNSQTTNPFSVTGGSVDITLKTRAGDCCNAEGWWDNVRIRKYDTVFVSIDTTEVLVKDSLTAGDYVINFTDINGNVYSDTFTISEPPAIQVSINAADAGCYLSADGNAAVTASGGNPPYNFSWSTGAVTDSIFNLSPGLYIVTVTDSNGCASVDSVIIDQPLALLVNLQAEGIPCFGEDDGMGFANVAGGTPPYSYNWSDGQVTDTVRNLSAGTYYVTVTDSNDCVATDSLIISQPSELMLSLQGEAVSCFGEDDGKGIADVAGGDPPFVYSWSDGQVTDTALNLSGGTYFITVFDSNGCAKTDTLVINEPSELTLTTQGEDVSCFGENDGSGVATATGGDPPYTYSWSNGQTTDSLQLMGGTYYVTVTDNNGCMDTSSVSIEQPDSALNISLSGSDTICSATNSGSIFSNITGGTAPYFYTWSEGGITTPSLTDVSEGTYTVTALDINGCSVVETFSITDDTITTSASASPDSIIQYGTSVELTATGPGNYDYSWTPVEHLTDPMAQTTTASPLETTNYTVVATDANGCTAMASITIIVENKSKINVPTAFSPNGDGFNDVFKIFPVGEIEIIDFKIFNRWGQIVFEADNASFGWDGIYEEEEQDIGTYVYIVKAKDLLNGEMITESGNITLIR